jgi:S1-C subfamily serine protease
MKLKFFFILALVNVVYTTTAAQISLEVIIKSLVQIDVRSNVSNIIKSDDVIEKDEKHGTGFYISPKGYIITAAHLVSKRSTISDDPISCKEYNSPKEFIAYIVYVDTLNDIAIIRNPHQDPRPAFINLTKINLDKSSELLFALGFPNENRDNSSIFAMSTGGLITKIPKSLKDTQKYRASKSVATSIPVTHGFSGGPVFDFNYKFIGITTSVFRDNKKSITLLADPDIIKSAIQKYVK